MAGTHVGGKKAAQALKLHYGKDYFHRLGLKGGNPYLNNIRDKKKLELQNVLPGQDGLEDKRELD